MATIKTVFPASFFADEEMVLRVSSETKRLWSVELDLLAELERVCKKHDIKFFAISGTLIGAARHGGFIPWDDDIDVVMMRTEYVRLKKVASEEFKHPYFLLTTDTDPESIRGHAQLRNSTTTAILYDEMRNGRAVYAFNQGIFLDIFPLDKIPDKEADKERFLCELQKIKRRICTLRHNRECARGWREMPKTIGTIKRALLGVMELSWRKLSGNDALVKACRQLELVSQKYNTTSAKKCAPVMFNPALRKHEVFNVSDFSDSVVLPFATMEIPCPKNYDEVLTRTFGDWHKHVIGGACHGKMLIDTERPYSHYLERKDA